MNKIFIGGIFIISVTISADASIVSRSFLDKTLTNYATSTTLDLKADKADVTTLSEIVGTPAEFTYEDMLTRPMDHLLGGYFTRYENTQIPTNNISEFIKLSYTDISFPGVAGLMNALFVPNSKEDQWPIRLYEIFSDYEEMFIETGQQDMFNVIALGYNGFYGLPKLTNEVSKIGTIPEGYNTLADALAAVKITADTAKELAEKAIPNVLNETGNGKYVLTAEKVGDTATYKWEIIDRSTTETATK